MARYIPGNRLIARLAGATDLLRHRMRLKGGFGGAFNGQRRRISIIEAIISNGHFGCAIETGTYRGTTTRFLADRFPRVVSIESNPRYHTFARLRLRKHTNVELVEGESIVQLPAILGRQNSGEPVFAYLDAHWGGDLPLGEELRILEDSGVDYVAVIDDFEVPGDDGYGYDCYSPRRGGVIGPALVFRAAPRLRYVWVPALPSEMETGSIRGTGFVASNRMEPLLEALARSNQLRVVERSS